MEGQKRGFVRSTGLGVASGAGSVAISAAVNSTVLNASGSEYVAIAWSAPVVEELTKNGLAHMLGGNNLLSHVSFGAVEGVLYSGENPNFGHLRPLLHASFGALFLLGSGFGRDLVRGFLVATLAHLAWNHYALGRIGMLPWQKVKAPAGMVLLSASSGEEKPRTWDEIKRKVFI